MTRKNLIIISSLLVITALAGAGYYYRDTISHQLSPNTSEQEALPQENTEKPPEESSAENTTEPVQTDGIDIKPGEVSVPSEKVDTLSDKVKVDTKTILTDEKKALLAQIKEATDKRDYVAFAALDKQVYDRHWISEPDFYVAESKAYMQATNELFEKGKLDEALAAGTVVYEKIPTGWRFRYLRIRTLEKMGRDAFARGDLATAEEKAKLMMMIMYRPEAADMLADIAIKRINDAMVINDIAAARTAYIDIRDYEVTPAKKKTIEDLATKYHLK